MKRLIRVRSLHPRLYCKSQSTRDVVTQMYKKLFTVAQTAGFISVGTLGFMTKNHNGGTRLSKMEAG
jgi:hypothetical protein